MIDRLPPAWREKLGSGLFRNTLALLSGTVVTQAIIFLASPLLSRIFGMDDFGDLANFNAWVAVLALLSNLRYEHAIIVANGRKHISRVVALSVLLSVASFGVYLLCAVYIHEFYQGTGYLSHLRRVVLFIPIGTLAVCVTSVFIQLNVKTGRFKRVAAVSAIQIPVTLAPQIILGRLGTEHALIFGTVAGYVVSSLVYFRYFLQEERLGELRAALSLVHLRATARQHLDFPRYTLPADTITVVSQQFIPVFVLALFGPAVAGLYAFAIRIVRVPLLVVSSAVSGALRKEASDRVHAGRELSSLFSGTARTLAGLSVIPFVVVALFAKPLFAVVFGPQWIDAGKVVQILSPGILLEFVAVPLTIFFLVTNSQWYTLAIQASGFALLVGALVLGRYYLHDFLTVCYVVTGVMTTVNLASIVLAAKVAGARTVRTPAEVV